MEMPGIEPGASHMQSVRSTTELHPLHDIHEVSDHCYINLILILIKLYHLFLLCPMTSLLSAVSGYIDQLEV